MFMWGNLCIFMHMCIYIYICKLAALVRCARKFIGDQAPWEPSVSSMGHLGNLFVGTDIYKYAHVCV